MKGGKALDRDAREFLHALMAEQRRLAAKAAGFLAGYVLVATTSYVLLDVYVPESNAADAWVGVFDWALGYLVFLAVMHRGGLTAGGPRTGIGTYFVLDLLIAIPVFLGLLALFVPGLYLLMRWLPAYSRALMTHDGVVRAMGWSWERTAPWQRPLAMAMLLPLVPFAVFALAILADSLVYEHFGWTGYVVLSLVLNVASSLGSAGLTVYCVAAYKLVLDPDAVPGNGSDDGADHPFGTITPQA